MKVLVTGATGFVGRTILGMLQTADPPVCILVRDRKSSRLRASHFEGRFETRRGNILDASTLRDALAGMDAVIHLVGIISEIGENTFDHVHRHGTENLVQAAREAGVQRLIHMSALGTRPNAVARYHQSKWAAEEIVRKSGLDFTIFRPAIIYGPGDGFVNLFARISRYSPVLPVMGDGHSRFQPIALENVAACFVRALNEPRSVGQTYDLCGTEVFTLNEILDLILEVTGRKRLKLHVPWGIARCQAAFLELLFPLLLRQAPPLNRDQLLMLQEDNLGNPKPAMELFAIGPSSFQARIAGYLRPGR